MKKIDINAYNPGAIWIKPIESIYAQTGLAFIILSPEDYQKLQKSQYKLALVNKGIKNDKRKGNHKRKGSSRRTQRKSKNPARKSE